MAVWPPPVGAVTAPGAHRALHSALCWRGRLLDGSLLPLGLNTRRAEIPRTPPQGPCSPSDAKSHSPGLHAAPPRPPPLLRARGLVRDAAPPRQPARAQLGSRPAALSSTRSPSRSARDSLVPRPPGQDLRLQWGGDPRGRVPSLRSRAGDRSCPAPHASNSSGVAWDPRCTPAGDSGGSAPLRPAPGREPPRVSAHQGSQAGPATGDGNREHSWAAGHQGQPPAGRGVPWRWEAEAQGRTGPAGGGA